MYAFPDNHFLVFYRKWNDDLATKAEKEDEPKITKDYEQKLEKISKISKISTQNKNSFHLQNLENLIINVNKKKAKEIK